jgi:N-acylneuraminate cytidylyltransferase
MSVVRYSHPIQRALQIDSQDRLSFIYLENALFRTQDLPPCYHDAGQFYFLKIDAFMQNKRLVSTNTITLEISEQQVQDIDTEEDWKIAELKYRIRQNIF